ncbi:hypothetical protein LOOC260_105750 [Paucilactobacillus hokkaidonensis JCM 18461]|uniref:Cytoplasmic protein n=2 Tax=Paucilactobacillus hokkaidonensis TaxID=1193095 RepID=A0A0A1GS95_9LACO|nr:DUF4312 family protein [Paucilactobacillus hokkaidonensis]BAP85132.1 hypothetical protein LOOC260_105750 [Paucilactobacillus hokkaidonensis JCM 18461]
MINDSVAKQKFETLRLVGQGTKKQQAFANAFAKIQKDLVKDESKVTVRIEPIEVNLVSAVKESYKEKFLFFFFPRTRVNYSVTLDVKVKITDIDINSLNFVSQQLPSPDKINIPHFGIFAKEEK